ncbi:hypothetical protein [Dictyobacter halimunensis]
MKHLVGGHIFERQNQEISNGDIIFNNEDDLERFRLFDFFRLKCLLYVIFLPFLVVIEIELFLPRLIQTERFILGRLADLL